MDGGNATRIERIVDGGAAMLFAGALAYAAFRIGTDGASAGAAGGLGFVGCLCALRRVQPEVPLFILGDLDCIDLEFAAAELVLTDADRLNPPAAACSDELLLDRPLAHAGVGSRVVQLFEPAAMPTAGELKERIDRHLADCPQPGPADDSQALYDALAELRRSLR